jgi:hypothetical protein
MNKLLSGRFILTVIAGGVFAYASCTGILEAQAVAAVISMVFISYFERRDRA